MDFQNLSTSALSSESEALQHATQIRGWSYKFKSVEYVYLKVVCPKQYMFHYMDLFPPLLDSLNDVTDTFFIHNEATIGAELASIGISNPNKWRDIFSCGRGFIELQLVVPKQLHESAEKFFITMEQSFGTNAISKCNWGYRLDQSAIVPTLERNDPHFKESCPAVEVAVALTDYYGLYTELERLEIALDILRYLNGGRPVELVVPQCIQYALKQQTQFLDILKQYSNMELGLSRARIVRILGIPIFYLYAERARALLRVPQLPFKNIAFAGEMAEELDNYILDMHKKYPVCAVRADSLELQ